MSPRRFEVVETRIAAGQVREMHLAPLDGAAPGWRAGAHVRVALPDGGDRPYSLVNLDPTPGATAAPQRYRLGVLLEPQGRGGSAWMHGLARGDVVTLGAPENDFPLRPSEAAPLLLAGGVGVTPIASMAAELTAEGRDFRLVYAGRARAGMAFVDELATLCGPRLEVRPDDAAPLDLAALFAGLDPDRDVYVCGPKGMIDAARRAAETAGHPRARFHVELFAPEAPAAGDAPFEVVVASSGLTVAVPPGLSIIDALEAAGMDVMHDCRRGDCGICQTGVLEGEPDHRDVVLSDAERASGKVMQICVSRARSARLVLDL